MQRLPTRDITPKPAPLQTSKSFTRFEAPLSSPPARSRAKTLHEVSPSAALHSPALSAPTDSAPKQDHDIFETPSQAGTEGEEEDVSVESFAEGYEDLPIEIQSLMERFVIFIRIRVSYDQTKSRLTRSPSDSSSLSQRKSIRRLFQSSVFPNCTRTSTSTRMLRSTYTSPRSRRRFPETPLRLRRSLLHDPMCREPVLGGSRRIESLRLNLWGMNTRC